MKRPLLSILLIAQAQFLFGQLTNEDVYNFEIGDVFQIKHSGAGSGSGPTYTDTVVNKYYSIGLDTIFYIIQRNEFAPAFPPYPQVNNSYLDTLIITSLNDPASHFVYNSCLPPKDTSFVNSCSAYTDRVQSDFDSTCFEPPAWHSDLLMGLGGPYYYVFDPVYQGTPSEWFSRTLEYYNTSAHGECGEFIALGIDSEKREGSINVSIFPNPVTNKTIHIHTRDNNLFLDILSLQGELVMTGITMQCQSVTIDSFKPGVYILRFTNNNGNYVLKKVVVL